LKQEDGKGSYSRRGWKSQYKQKEKNTKESKTALKEKPVFVLSLKKSITPL
jgi:hypothetical protein